jgi:hypothetical protein
LSATALSAAALSGAALSAAGLSATALPNALSTAAACACDPLWAATEVSGPLAWARHAARSLATVGSDGSMPRWIRDQRLVLWPRSD